MNRKFPFLIILLGPLVSVSAFTPTTDGLYAVFNVSIRQSNGQFTSKEIAARLLYEDVPVTVANFVGLAEGTYDWYDFQEDIIRSNTPYFNGMEFHRIVPNFVIQAGSRDGSGGDGPGWTIPDEIVPELKHLEAGGALSMANSSSRGIINSGGSQFFITMIQFPGQNQLVGLDGIHSIFGMIVDRENQLVAQEIGRVPLFGPRPHPWPVTIESVKIIRQGAAAQAFNPTDHWQPPSFQGGKLETNFKLQDHDNNPDTDEVPILRWSFERNRDNHYFIEGTNDLTTWAVNHSFRRGEARASGPIYRDIRNDVAADGRHFYRMLESIYPPLPDPPLPGDAGTKLNIQMDEVDVDPGQVPFVSESLSLTLASNHKGYWELKRSDNDAIKPIGEIEFYQWWNLSGKHQVSLDFDSFSDLQVYLTPTSANSGNAYIHYQAARPEGANITGTYTLDTEDEGKIRLNKDGLKLIFDIVDTPPGGDPITSVLEIDLWDQFADQDPGDHPTYEGSWRLTQSNSEFVDIGRLAYSWFEGDGKIQLLLDFDNFSDIHFQMDDPIATSGAADAYFKAPAQFDTVSYSSGPGDGRPVGLDKNLTRLSLAFNLSGDDTDSAQSNIILDFYENFQGGYQSTTTENDITLFGNVTSYEWIETNDETRVELTYDGLILDMRIFLTDTSTNSGTAKVNLLTNGAVLDATYTIGVGQPRPEPLDLEGNRLTLDYLDEEVETRYLHIDFYDNFEAGFTRTRKNDQARPTGNIREYRWTNHGEDDLLDNELLVLDFEFELDTQIEMTFTGQESGEAKVYLPDTGSLTTVPFDFGPGLPRPVPLNKAGTKLTLNLGSDTITTLTINFRDDCAGDGTRIIPQSSTPSNGTMSSYSWVEHTGYDHIMVQLTGLLVGQIFLNYSSATTGGATLFLDGSGTVQEGTFTIGAADPPIAVEPG